MKKVLFSILKSEKSSNALRQKLDLARNVGRNPFDKTTFTGSAKRLQVGMKSSSVSNLSVGATSMGKDIPKVDAEATLFRGWHIKESRVILQTPHPFSKLHGAYPVLPFLTRSFASSSAPQSSGQTEQQHRKDISAYEDPFDAPTSNIPEKPVTFVEGASYSVIILFGLGLAAAVVYTACKEFLFEPKEYTVFGKALERVQNDNKVRELIGTPIKGYGTESQNRGQRRIIPHEIWTDEDGVERVKISFIARGPNGAANVLAEMFKDKEDKEWKYTSLLVQTNSRRPVLLMLESYVPESIPVKSR